MRIRMFEDKDIGQINEIYSHYVLNTVISFDYEAPTIDQMKDKIQHATEKFPCLVCEDSGVIIGYIYAAPYAKKIAYQWDVEISIYLNPNCCGKGIGKLLYTIMLQILKEQGIVNVYAGITSINNASIAFHEKLGFQIVAKFPMNGYKFQRWLDVIWMHKSINDYAVNMVQPRGICEIADEKIQSAIDKYTDILIGYKSELTIDNSEYL